MSERERQLLMLNRMGIGQLWTARHAAGAPPDVGENPAARLADAGGERADVVVAASVLEDDLPSALAAARPSQEAVADAEPVIARATEPVGPGMLDAASGTAIPDWSVLQQTVSSCTACGLCQGRNRTVFGVGDRQASWLFVGEGPGRQEDLKGEPFVGPAGKLLDNMLRSLGLGRDADAYIANVVKCRPTAEDGRDRPPTPEEIAACLPFLQQQIAALQPDVIVALGRIAAVALLGLPADTPVGSLRGKLHQYQGKPLVVTYHPAYLLRQPADKAKVWRDLCMARAAHAAHAAQLAQA